MLVGMKSAAFVRSLILSLFVFPVVFGQEADPDELPRITAVAPEKALETFRLRPGIALDLVASEPLVEDPVSIAFDEDGRLFAVEMRGYSERRDENRGQVRLLFDDDDNGVFDRSTVFAKDLRWPTGLVCSRGGVFIVAAPDLIWLKDNDGDGVADEREVIFTGFASGAKKLNVQGLPNSLKWGPDNRIWGSSGTLGGRIHRPGQPEKDGVNLSGSDFSFDPKTFDFRAENGRAQYGLSFDSHGRRYVSSNSIHIMAVMWERGWAAPNPWFSLPKPFVSIASDGGAAPVFRISPDEPWRIVRTRWRVSGVVKGAVEGGGRVSGYFTGASGITIYTGDALGPDYVDNAFIGDVGSNLVHRKLISNHEGKVSLRADRSPDEAEREFIASTDNWFRPTTYANAPDGCLYISDMYREIIEHPWSLPPGIKKHLDLNSGTDRGRIYRVRPVDFERRGTMTLSNATDEALIRLLEHPNGWHRTTAQRLLWERGGQIEGWGALTKSDPSLEKLKAPFQLASSSGDEKVAKLAATLTTSPDDEWLVAATLHAVTSPDEASSLFGKLTQNGLGDQTYLTALAEMIGKMNDTEAVAAVISVAARQGGSAMTAELLEALGRGLKHSGSSLEKADKRDQLKLVFATARESVSDDSSPMAKRLAAVRLLSFSSGKATEKALYSVLESPENSALHFPAIESLEKIGVNSLVDKLIKNWDQLDGSVQSRAVNLLIKSPRYVEDAITALEKERLPGLVLDLSQLQLLRQSKSKAIRERIEKLYPEAKPVPRAEVVARFQGAKSLQGDAKNGALIFQTACASCHRNGDIGHEVGPDVATFRTAGADSIIQNLFDPNKEIAPQYQAFLFSLKNGEQAMGIIDNESPKEVSVKMAFGVAKTFPRTEVTSMKSLGRSLMPEGLEATLTEQTLADLLAYIAGEAE